jgi:hypothetical protein
MDLQMLKLYKSWSFVIISYNVAIKKRRYNKNKNKNKYKYNNNK